ncbi:MAG: hypothetical protein M3Y26_06475, partial [Actinomycetota bacterium]|nr:hypothetical protein [Actinomycetota bacterium]
VERWRQLPLDHALSRMPVVRALIQQLADSAAEEEGRARIPVPDLGPSVVMDQLTVMVHDAASGAGAEAMADRLVELRRAL